MLYLKVPDPDSEANVAVELFSGALSSGVAYTTYVGDDDSAKRENHRKALVTYDIEKWRHKSCKLSARNTFICSKREGERVDTEYYILHSEVPHLLR